MNDGLPPAEAEAMEAAFQVDVVAHEPASFGAGWLACREYARVDIEINEQCIDRLREAEQREKTLRQALSGVAVQHCREWVYEEANYCYAPAEFVLWGKLLKPEALGPRCYDHAALHVGHPALVPGANFALIDLRPAAAALAPGGSDDE